MFTETETKSGEYHYLTFKNYFVQENCFCNNN